MGSLKQQKKDNKLYLNKRFIYCFLILIFVITMKKIVVFGFFLSVLILISLQSVNAIVLKNEEESINFSMTVEKKSLGWHITTTLTNNGDEWIYVEKDGYGDIGCIIYDTEDNEIWWTYSPEEGMDWQIGLDAAYESFTIWTGTNMDKNKVEKGTYKIVGASGYFDGDEYIPLRTEPYYVEVTNTKTKSIFFNTVLSHLLNWFQLLENYFIF